MGVVERVGRVGPGHILKLITFFVTKKKKKTFLKSIIIGKSTYLADLGEARGCSANTSVTKLINSLTQPWFVELSLRRRHALVVKHGAFIDYVSLFFWIF